MQTNATDNHAKRQIRHFHLTILHCFNVTFHFPVGVLAFASGSENCWKETMQVSSDGDLPVRDGLVPQPDLMLPRTTEMLDELVPKHLPGDAFLPNKALHSIF